LSFRARLLCKRPGTTLKYNGARQFFYIALDKMTLQRTGQSFRSMLHAKRASILT